VAPPRDLGPGAPCTIPSQGSQDLLHQGCAGALEIYETLRRASEGDPQLKRSRLFLSIARPVTTSQHIYRSHIYNYDITSLDAQVLRASSGPVTDPTSLATDCHARRRRHADLCRFQTAGRRVCRPFPGSRSTSDSRTPSQHDGLGARDTHPCDWPGRGGRRLCRAEEPGPVGAVDPGASVARGALTRTGTSLACRSSPPLGSRKPWWPRGRLKARNRGVSQRSV
jgi:hypothetical protein